MSTLEIISTTEKGDVTLAAQPKSQPSREPETNCAVNSHNEWDLLEEVIVGVADGAAFPPWHVSVEAPLPANQRKFFQKHAGRPFPAELIEAANKELDEFVHVLEGEGVVVRRPIPSDQLESYGAPGWTSTGLYDAMPRDVFLVVGNEIIECPMAWRSRYYATSGYRELLKEYFHSGAKWSAAPKPELKDELYNFEWTEHKPGQPVHLAITEFEPTFDAADFVRCGRDIFAQKSNVTNDFGIEWLRRHLGPNYRIHVFQFNDKAPMHIDATLMPLAPGKLLINPDRVPEVPRIFKHWDVYHSPRPIIPPEHALYMTSKWINMNLLMLDEERVVVERRDEPMIAVLEEWGFKPVLCSFRHFNTFGGSFHCATLDVRRRGSLQSYF